MGLISLISFFKLMEPIELFKPFELSFSKRI